MKKRHDGREEPGPSTRRGSAGNTPDSKKSTPPKFPPLPSPQESEGGVLAGKVRKRNLSSASVCSNTSSLKSSKFPNRQGISWRANARIEAMDFLEKWYPAKIVEIDEDDLTILIHFEGWNQRYDEWVPMTSDRLRPMTRHSDRKEGKPVTKLVHKLGEKVLAKWTDCRMYPAKVVSVNQNGSYDVVFYDGYKKTIQPINLKPLPPHMQEEVQNITFPTLPPPPPVPASKKKDDALLPRSRSNERSKTTETDTPKSRDRSKSSGSEQGEGCILLYGAIPRRNSEKSSESCNPMLSRRERRQSKSTESKPLRRKTTEDTSSEIGEPKPSELSNVFKRKRKIKVGGIFQSKKPRLDPDVVAQKSSPPQSGSKPKIPGAPKVVKLSDLPKPGVQLSPGGHVLAMPRSPGRIGSPVRSPGMSPTRSPIKVEQKSGGTRTVADIKKKLMNKRKQIEAERQAKHLAEEAAKQQALGAPEGEKGKVSGPQSPPAPPAPLSTPPEQPPPKEPPETDEPLSAPAVKVEQPEPSTDSESIADVPPVTSDTPPPPQKVLENLLKGAEKLETRETKENKTKDSVPAEPKTDTSLTIDSIEPTTKAPKPTTKTKDLPSESPSGRSAPTKSKDSATPPSVLKSSCRTKNESGGTKTVSTRTKQATSKQKPERRNRKRTQSMPAPVQEDSNSAASSDGSVTAKVASKAFKIDPDHNQFKCPWDDCGKGFRKEKLLTYHIKYYHSNDGKPPPPPPPRRRKKTVSTCSTDSEAVAPKPEKASKSKAAKKVRGHSAPSIIVPELIQAVVEEVTSPEVKLEIEEVEEEKELVSVDQAEVAVAESSSLEKRERQDSIGTESVDIVTEDENASKDEVVNCTCRFNEENGLMIQCEVCLTWQHVACINISEESLPQKYVCWVCLNPPGVRDSARFIYDQEWLKQGTLPRFNFLPSHDKGRRSPVMKATHSLAGDIHGLSQMITAVKKKISILNKEDHEDLKIWIKNWEQEPDDDDDDDEEIKPGDEILLEQNTSAVAMETDQAVDTNLGMDQLESSANFLSTSRGALDLKDFDEKNVIPPYADLENQEIILGELEETANSAPRSADDEDMKLEIESSDTELDTSIDHKMGNGISPASSSATIIMDPDSLRSGSPELAEPDVQLEHMEIGESGGEKMDIETDTNRNMNSNNLDISRDAPNGDSSPKLDDESVKLSGAGDMVPKDSSSMSEGNAESGVTDLAALASGAISPESIENATNPLCDDIESVTSPNLVGDCSKDLLPGEESHTEHAAAPKSGRSSAALSDHSYVPIQSQDYKLSPVPSRIRLTGSSVWTPVTKNLSNMEEASTSHEAAVTIVTNPFENCKQNLLAHISGVQDDIDTRLDFIEEQVAALEAMDEATKTSQQDPLSDLPQVKKSLRTLLHDLAKVKRLSTFH